MTHQFQFCQLAGFCSFTPQLRAERASEPAQAVGLYRYQACRHGISNLRSFSWQNRFLARPERDLKFPGHPSQPTTLSGRASRTNRLKDVPEVGPRQGGARGGSNGSCRVLPRPGGSGQQPPGRCRRSAPPDGTRGCRRQTLPMAQRGRRSALGPGPG